MSENDALIFDWSLIDMQLMIAIIPDISGINTKYYTVEILIENVLSYSNSQGNTWTFTKISN